MSEVFDVCVIGGGPGGYVCAIRASQMGLKTVVVEKGNLGGVCLNVGCIPSKALITASHFFHKANHHAEDMGITFGSVKLNMKKLNTWKQSVCDRMSGGVEQLLKANKVKCIQEEVEFKNDKELVGKKSKTKIVAKHYVIATGSRPIDLPDFKIDEKTVLSSTGALNLSQLPKKIVVIGGGYIGLEISSYLAKLGTQVEVLEAGSQLLEGVADKDCVRVVERKLKKLGVQVHLGAQALSHSKKGTSVEVKVKMKGATKTLKADKILLTVGRKPNSDQMNLKNIGLAIDNKGFLKVNPQCQTNKSHIYAIGDIAGQPMLAHKASYEGVLVAEVLAGKNRAFDAKTVPAVIFTDPEMASAGFTEEEARAKGYQLKINQFPFTANGRAVSLMEAEGFIKMIADEKTNILLGVHIVGPEASNLISEAVLAIEMGARLEDVALSIHPHPTLGEAFMESAEATLGHAIHMINKKK